MSGVATNFSKNKSSIMMTEILSLSAFGDTSLTSWATILPNSSWEKDAQKMVVDCVVDYD